MLQAYLIAIRVYISIGQESWCLLYAEFLMLGYKYSAAKGNHLKKISHIGPTFVHQGQGKKLNRTYSALPGTTKEKFPQLELGATLSLPTVNSCSSLRG